MQDSGTKASKSDLGISNVTKSEGRETGPIGPEKGESKETGQGAAD